MSAVTIEDDIDDDEVDRAPRRSGPGGLSPGLARWLDCLTFF